MIDNLYRLFVILRHKSGAVTPGAESPFGQNASVATPADMTELASCIESIFRTAAPGTNLHRFGYRLVTFDASEQNGKNSLVLYDK